MATGTAAIAYELFASATRRPRLSQLGHRFPYDLFVWAWIGTLVFHLVQEWVNDEVDHAWT